MNLNRTLIAPLSSAIIALMLAGAIVVGIDQIEPKLKEGEVRLSGKGLVEVSIAGADFVRSARTRILRPEDRVRVLTGEATLELPGNSEAFLRQGSMVLVPGASLGDLVLQEGELLVDSKSQEVSVEGGVALASVIGAAKLRRSESLAVGVYKGNVSLVKGDSVLNVQQYRQAAAAGTGILPGQVDPLSLDPADDWDRRMLPEVLDLDDKLQKFGREFEDALPAGRATDSTLYGQVIPTLSGSPLAGILSGNRAAAENIIGLTLVSLDTGNFDSRVQNIFGFRARGARWGLVAADRNLNPNPVLGGVEQALGRLEVALAPPGSLGSNGTNGRGGGKTQIGGSISNGSNGSGTGSGVPTGTTPAGTPGGSTGSNPGGTPGTDPGTTPPPSTPPPPKNQKRIDLPPVGLGLDPLLDPLVNPLENLLSGLLDGLLGPMDGTSAPSASTGTATPAAVTTAPAPAAATTTTTSPSLLGGVLGLLK